MGPVQDILSFLTTLGFPSPLNVALTNKVKVKVGLKIPMAAELNKFLPPGGPQFSDTSVVVSETIANPISSASFQLGATILIPTPFDPLMAVGLIKLKLQMSTSSGNTFTLTVGAGLGVSFEVGGFGVGLLIKGTISLVIVSVGVSVKAKMAILKVTKPPGTLTIYGEAQVTFAIDITIWWVINIDIEVSAKEDQNLNGGTSALPDVL